MIRLRLWLSPWKKNRLKKPTHLKRMLVFRKCLKTAGAFLSLEAIIIYFKKDSLLPAMNYGSRLVIRRELQEIRNSGNPGGFDYKQYCLFQKITHQVFLNVGDYALLSSIRKKWLTSFIVCQP
jgi:hypothetical protein